MYRCETTSVHGFIQQLAVCYVGRGYWFYTTGWIPEKKDPRQIDARIIDRYGIDVSPAERCRRKKAGRASVQYLRHGRFFVLLATLGHHRLREEEKLQDVARLSFKYGGYQVTYRDGHPRVSIELEEYKRRKAEFLDRALRRSAGDLEERFRNLPFEPYAPVRSQLLVIWRAVNALRGSQGLPPVDRSCLRFKRRIYRPFADDGTDTPLEASLPPLAANVGPA